MRFFSMFSGIGTGEQGIEQAYSNGFSKPECVGFSEVDPICDRFIDGKKCEGKHELISETKSKCGKCGQIKNQHAAAIYKFHHPNHKNYGDATKIIPSELPDFDFLIGGFPCQAFSIAGKRLGFEDTRGTLFFEIARILREKRPSHFLLENVAGLLSHDNGNTFRTIIATLDEIGYDLEWTVINSKDHGVPQNRERVFIIGHPRNGSCGKVFPFGGSDEETFGERGNHGVASTIRNGELRETGDVALALDANYHKGPDNHGQRTVIGTLRTHKDGKGFREMKSNIAPALNARARQDGSGQAVIYASRGRYNENGEIEQNLEPRHDGATNTITSVEKDNLLMTNRRIRRLTPIECERLQGCPDDFTKYGRYGDEVKEVADTNRYKGLGNAFTVNVIEAIITAMREAGCLD